MRKTFFAALALLLCSAQALADRVVHTRPDSIFQATMTLPDDNIWSNPGSSDIDPYTVPHFCPRARCITFIAQPVGIGGPLGLFEGLHQVQTAYLQAESAIDYVGFGWDGAAVFEDPELSVRFQVFDALSGDLLADQTHSGRDVYDFSADHLGASNAVMLTMTFDVAPGVDAYGIVHEGARTSVGLVVVPEPSTFALVLAGLAVMGFTARRGRRSAR